VESAGGIGKGHQTNSGFSARGTTPCATRRIGNALRLKLQGTAVAFQDRAGCFDITLPAIVAEDPIMADAHESRREDMQAETPDELQSAEG
jgi:hypothetical protein